MGLTVVLRGVHTLICMAEQTSQLMALDDLCKKLADRWLSVTGLPVESNACVFAARVAGGG